MSFRPSSAIVFLAAATCAAADISALPDYIRVDPAGAVVEPDRESARAPAGEITLEGARAGYVSCQLVVRIPDTGEYRLEVAPFPSTSGLQTDLYREWFHYLPTAKVYIPDALIPVPGSYRSTMAESDNKVPNQAVQVFWLDIWIPGSAPEGSYETSAMLRSKAGEDRLPIRVKVLEAVIPADDAVTIDHNTYGTSWFGAQYPKLVAQDGDAFWNSDRFYGLIHSYHRIFYEHRGVLHQLGYGHAGKVGPEFAPRLAGSGKTRHVDDWTAYDRHYGPLFDGSAFANTRRGPRPIPFAYLPVNPEWPASFLWWGQPGYEREFVNVLSEMESHFRQKGWTHTNFELFFNHKKRYKGFNWDGDEARFAKDYDYLREYARLLRVAVPSGSPVKFVTRADASWTMERQFHELAGVVNFWVCGSGMLAWYRDSVPTLEKRGDIVWIYGGTPAVTEPVSHVATEVLRAWLWGVGGYVRWMATDPGKDPWFHFGGGGETMVYPGDRFGIGEPIPSIRLKAERNALQDIALLNDFRSRRPIAGLRAEAARRFNSTTLDEWWSPRPALADTNPENWTNTTIDDASPKNPKFEHIDAGAWHRVHDFVLELAREGR